MPRISVITCTFDRMDLVGRAVDSLLNQTFQDWEQILVNDGGQTPKFKPDPRIRFFDRDHVGAVGTFNFAFQQAQGDYICFLDDDDIYYPFNLRIKLDAIENCGTDIVHTPCYTNTNGVLEKFGGGEWTIKNLLKGCFMPNLGVIYKRELLDRVGLLDPRVWIFYDWEWQLRACKLGVTNTFHDCAPVGEYIIHPKSSIRSELAAGHRQKLDDVMKMVRSWYADS